MGRSVTFPTVDCVKLQVSYNVKIKKKTDEKCHCLDMQALKEVTLKSFTNEENMENVTLRVLLLLQKKGILFVGDISTQPMCEEAPFNSNFLNPMVVLYN